MLKIFVTLAANHLTGVQLQSHRYPRWSEIWDRGHRSTCWAKFTESDGRVIDEIKTGREHWRGGDTLGS